MQMGAFGAVHQHATRETIHEVLGRMHTLVERPVKEVLVADGDDKRRAVLVEALTAENLAIKDFSSGQQAIDALCQGHFDCMVLGPNLSDMTSIELVRKTVESATITELPLVIYGSEGLNSTSEHGSPGLNLGHNLGKLAEIAILKNLATPDDVLHETTLFLHHTINSLPPKKRESLANSSALSSELAGMKVLIVDDDIRNIFALTGALEQHNIIVFNAENGKEGIETLKNNPDMDVVLMDIMMPELDGYDTTRIIRGLERFRNLPIIAVTAKAMPGDREKCIEAGASDYIAKPVNIEQLLSLLRVWRTNEVEAI